MIEMVETMEAREGDDSASSSPLPSPATFIRDKWVREDGKGYGLSCVLQDGRHFQKAGINTSRLVIKYNPKQIATATERGNIERYKDMDPLDLELYANGCSVVIHPRNPHQPTTHANYRYIEVFNKRTN